MVNRKCFQAHLSFLVVAERRADGSRGLESTELTHKRSASRQRRLSCADEASALQDKSLCRCLSRGRNILFSQFNDHINVVISHEDLFRACSSSTPTGCLLAACRTLQQFRPSPRRSLGAYRL